MIGKLIYCSGMGCGPWWYFKGLTNDAGKSPSWLQTMGKTAILTYNGRVAIRLLCKLWGLGTNDEILAPAYNCGAEIDPMLLTGAKVKLYRVHRDTTIDFDDICLLTTFKTRVIYVTHYFGWLQRLSKLRRWCSERGILLVEDCALALFSSGDDGPAGATGDAAIYSIWKFFPVPDGGMLVLNSGANPNGIELKPPPPWKTLCNMLPLVKRHFVRKSESSCLYAVARKLKLSHFRIDPEVKTDGLPDMPVGYYFDHTTDNWSISEVSKAFLQQVDREEVIRRRVDNYHMLCEEVDSIPGVSLLFGSLPEGICPYGLPVTVSGSARWSKALNACGIGTFPFWKGYHKDLPWEKFPDARYLKDNVLLLPVYQDMGFEHIEFIGRCMRYVAKRIGQ